MLNIIIAALSYALFQVLASYAAQKIGNLWFLILGSFAAFFFAVLVGGWQMMQGVQLGKLNTAGIVLTLVANVGVALYLLFLGRSFQQVDPKIVIPLVFGGAILLSTLAVFILGRAMPTTAQMSSLVLIGGGLVLLGVTSR